MDSSQQHPDQLRRTALELVHASRPIAEVARELGVAEETLGYWVRTDRYANGSGAIRDALTESEREELRRLRKEALSLAVDKEILRRAAAHFVRETMR